MPFVFGDLSSSKSEMYLKKKQSLRMSSKSMRIFDVVSNVIIFIETSSDFKIYKVNIRLFE